MLLELYAIHSISFVVFLSILYIFRKRFFGELNLLGTFVIAWFVLDYLGMVITSLNPDLVFDYWDYLELTFFTDEKNFKMVLYSNLGLLIFLAGALLMPVPRQQGQEVLLDRQAFNHGPLRGMKIRRAVILFMVFIGLGFYLLVRDLGLNIPLWTLIVSDFSHAYSHRVEREISSPLQAYITWNIIPYLGIYIFTYFWFKAKRGSVYLFLALVPVVLSSVSLLALLHKREFITWLSVFGFLYLLLRKQNPRNLSLPILKLAIGGLLIYTVLVFCFVAFSSFTRLDQGLPWAIEVSFMELCFRGTLSSLPYFSLIPDLVSYHEFQNIGLFRRILGLPVSYSDTQILFSYLYPNLRDTSGSISSNMITDFYGAFGLPSLIICSFLGGVGLGILNYVFLKLSNRLPNLVFKAFLLLFPINLCIATYFQSAFGYGLFFYTVCWLFLGYERKTANPFSSTGYAQEKYPMQRHPQMITPTVRKTA